LRRDISMGSRRGERGTNESEVEGVKNEIEKSLVRGKKKALTQWH
jgi:hypothetical protein